MPWPLAKEQQQFVSRLVKSGRFNNQSEAICEAIRLMQREETEYLAPPPLTPDQVDALYTRPDKQADAVGRAIFKSLKAAAHKGARP